MTIRDALKVDVDPETGMPHGARPLLPSELTPDILDDVAFVAMALALSAVADENARLKRALKEKEEAA